MSWVPKKSLVSDTESHSSDATRVDSVSRHGVAGTGFVGAGGVPTATRSRSGGRTASGRAPSSSGRVGTRGAGTQGGSSVRVLLRQLDIFDPIVDPELLPERSNGVPNSRRHRLNSLAVDSFEVNPLAVNSAAVNSAAVNSAAVDSAAVNSVVVEPESPVEFAPLRDAPVLGPVATTSPATPAGSLPRLLVSLDAVPIDSRRTTAMGLGGRDLGRGRGLGWQGLAPQARSKPATDPSWEWARPASLMAVGGFAAEVRTKLGAATLDAREGLVWLAFTALMALAWFAV